MVFHLKRSGVSAVLLVLLFLDILSFTLSNLPACASSQVAPGYQPAAADPGTGGSLPTATRPADRTDRSVREPVHLLNGKNLNAFYTYLKGRGRDKDPKGVFTVVDGMLRISGEEMGCITTHDEYENYLLIAEFKWGQKTWVPRVERARDSGVLLHSVGEDGCYGGMWICSIEVQLIEGGTGDLLVVTDGTDQYALTAPARKQGDQTIYDPAGQPVTITSGRINWWGRDPAWQDAIGFRGPRDVEKPLGEWNRLECRAERDTIEVRLNGVLVNRCTNVKPSRGKIQVQSEGAELFFRRIDLLKLEASSPAAPREAERRAE